MSKLIIGGTTFKCGNKVDYQLERLETWRRLDSAHLVEMFPLRDGDPLFQIAKLWRLDCSLIEALRELHQKLLKWVLARHGAITVKKTDFPHNYTKEMIKFKNLDETDDVKGFCPFEPVVRIDQLLSTKWFSKLRLSDFTLPEAPPAQAPKKFTKGEEIYQYVKEKTKELRLWEEYFVECARVISEVEIQ